MSPLVEPPIGTVEPSREIIPHGLDIASSQIWDPSCLNRLRNNHSSLLVTGQVALARVVNGREQGLLLRRLGW
jgi:hypothetical protein